MAKICGCISSGKTDVNPSTTNTRFNVLSSEKFFVLYLLMVELIQWYIYNLNSDNLYVFLVKKIVNKVIVSE